MSFLTGLWPLIGGGVMALLGIAFGLFKHQQAKAATSDAEAVKSQAEKQVAQIQQEAADQNAAAAQHQAEAVQVKEAAQADAAKIPTADLDAELDKLGGLRK